MRVAVKIWADAKDENGICQACGKRIVWAVISNDNQSHPFDYPLETLVPEWNYAARRSTEIVASTSHFATCTALNFYGVRFTL